MIHTPLYLVLALAAIGAVATAVQLVRLKPWRKVARFDLTQWPMTGSVGVWAGIPIIVDDLVPKGQAFLVPHDFLNSLRAHPGVVMGHTRVDGDDLYGRLASISLASDGRAAFDHEEFFRRNMIQVMAEQRLLGSIYVRDPPERFIDITGN